MLVLFAIEAHVARMKRLTLSPAPPRPPPPPSPSPSPPPSPLPQAGVTASAAPHPSPSTSSTISLSVYSSACNFRPGLVTSAYRPPPSAGFLPAAFPPLPPLRPPPSSWLHMASFPPPPPYPPSSCCPPLPPPPPVNRPTAPPYFRPPWHSPWRDYRDNSVRLFSLSSCSLWEDLPMKFCDGNNITTVFCFALSSASDGIGGGGGAT